MDTSEIKQRLARPAIKFSAGGFRPLGTDEESWLVNVLLFRPEEGVPTNQAGQQLLPYAQFYLPALPFTSSLLKGVRVLTVFISNLFPEHFEPMGVGAAPGLTQLPTQDRPISKPAKIQHRQ